MRKVVQAILDSLDKVVLAEDEAALVATKCWHRAGSKTVSFNMLTLHVNKLEIGIKPDHLESASHGVAIGQDLYIKLDGKEISCPITHASFYMQKDEPVLLNLEVVP